MTRAQLFEDHRQVRRWHGSTALAICEPGCPECGVPLIEQTVDMAALFIHGGYGATRRTTFAVCPACRWSHERVVEEVKPEVRPARLG